MPRAKMNDQIKISLSPREKIILHWIAQGKNTEQISRILHLSRYTVENYLSNVRRKLNSSTIAQAMYQAMRQNLIEMENDKIQSDDN
jgi:DNA-binding CsgD family transcriptional regulator